MITRKKIFQISPALGIFVSALSFASPVRVLTYDSMLGHASLGEFLKTEFPKFCKGCEVEFTSTREFSGLVGRLRADKRRGATGKFDVVLGLDDVESSAASREKLVETPEAFDQSPFAIIVDTERLSRDSWPRSWKQLVAKLGPELLVEDPRTSSPGAGWLRAIFAMKAITPQEAKKVTKRVFPGWSSAYDAFLKGEGKAVWSYRASEAYHRCNEKTEKERSRYLALPLSEGYPAQQEWAAVVTGHSSESAKSFVRFLVSAQVQGAIPTRNWMYPVVKKTKLPDCFAQVTELKTWQSPAPISPLEIRRWTDEWSL
jgi:thiamine transport system substrate-binding protein